MKSIILDTKTKKSYIYIDNGGLKNAKELINSRINASKVHIITDTNVDKFYSDTLINQFDIPCSKTVIIAGEQSKTLDTVRDIYHDLHINNITKGDIIIALGGGVVGDISGFVASTYMRGIALCQIPTSLLAQVDSSVGGKCGVDLPFGKNLVGVINQPDVVIIDPTLIKTLPIRYYNDGMAEVIKYGYILDNAILTRLESIVTDMSLSEIITKCVSLKVDIVTQDEDDSGIRKILNFGHTIGHAVEKLGNFTYYSHGEAISIGMLMAIKIGRKLGFDSIDEDKLVSLLNRYNLPHSCSYTGDEIYNALLFDKKITADEISFILIKSEGEAVISQIQLKDIKKYLSQML